jgi:hypothetical protein
MFSFFLMTQLIYKKGTKISHSLLITATYSVVRCIFSTPDNFKLHHHLWRTREVLMFSSTGQKFASPGTHICAEKYTYLIPAKGHSTLQQKCHLV